MKTVTGVLGAMLLALSVNANAGLMGDQVTATWTYSSFYQSQSTVVGSGVEFQNTWGLGHDLDFGDDYILASVDGGGLAGGVSWDFTDLDIGRITGVSVTTNYSNWDNSWLSFTDDSVHVFFAQAASFPSQNFIRFTLQSVPEPAPVLLLAASVIALGVSFRRNQSSDRTPA